MVLIDADLKPSLNHKGIVAENSHGVWSIRCVNRAEVVKNAEMAGEICILLGFSGYSSHIVQRIGDHGEITQKPPINHNQHLNLNQFNMRSWDRFNIPVGRFIRSIQWKQPVEFNAKNNQFSEIVGTPRQCFALNVECVPHVIIPIQNPSNENPNNENVIINNTTTESPFIEPDDVTTEKPQIKPDKPAEPIKPIIQPDQKPTVIVPFEANNSTNEVVITENFNAPWAASIYINGKLACIGVLLGRYWILTHKNCVGSVKYVIKF